MFRRDFPELKRDFLIAREGLMVLVPQESHSKMSCLVAPTEMTSEEWISEQRERSLGCELYSSLGIDKTI